MMNDVKILVVDDEPYITFMISARLRELGCEVLVAHNGVEALDLALLHVPRVVISDLQMPRMDGLEFSRRLRADAKTSHIPVVMLTARGHKLTPSEMSLTNIQHLLPKPFSARELLGLVEEMCADSQGGFGGQVRDIAA
jgi:chemosensory pili system protein ChpA (sensor histidine kinase/response regulator)